MCPNLLALESSPYLRQHGDDPVQWYPWGERAFDLSRRTGKPIFLSVGYAACHWCHVMHRESFADDATAAVLNEHFVSVKVDRETRPDIDEVYMAYVVASTGRGGWPMSVFLTPELVPVFGGTYFPPFASFGMPSFPDVLDTLATTFSTRRAELAQTTQQAAGYLGAVFAPLEPGTPAEQVAADATRTIIAAADPVWGGFGAGTKFPQAPVVDFLLDYHQRTGDRDALHAATDATRQMLGGGIYDHVGGGISRYAVDREWLVPHFEKMLYDNAQLLQTLAKLQHIEPSDTWVRAMRGTVQFMERDLPHASGAYASSRDADTAGVEGATYVWTYDELRQLLSDEELRLAEQHLGVTEIGNWEGANILTRRPASPVAEAGATAADIDGLLGRLLEARRLRPQPALDDKAIVAWNALAVRGLLAAGDVLGDRAMTERALGVLATLLEEAVDERGGVRRVLRDEASADVRILEDAAGLVIALLEAAEITGDASLQERAREIFDASSSTFYDSQGTWYLTSADTELPARPREQHDGPAPSGASLSALAAVRLAESTGDARYREIAEATVGRFVPAAGRSPFAAGTALQALLMLLEAHSRA